MPQLLHAGRSLHFLDEGSGAPVLLIHSSGLTSRQWRSLSAQLRPRLRTVVPDLLGYGGSTPLESAPDFQFHEDVEAIAALVDHLGVPVHLVGHSYGGLIALQVALRRPALVRSLGLFEPVAFGILHDAPDGDALGEEERAQAESAQRLGSEHPGSDALWMEGFVDWWQGPGAWRSMPESSMAAFLKSAHKTYLEVRSLLADRTPASAYRAVTAPALLLSGDRSPRLAQRISERLAQALPRGRLVSVAGAGHMGPLTQMTQVNALLAANIIASDAAASDPSGDAAQAIPEGAT